MSEPSVESQSLPQPLVRNRRRQDAWLIWLLPVVAAIAGAVLVVRSYQSAGPVITISFKTAEGLDENTTTVKFKNVVVGKVKSIRLGEDRESVRVTVGLTQDAEAYAVEDTRFWVERPRVDLSGISGLNTLVSGAYIGMDPGASPEPRLDFVGLEAPPPVTHGQRGLRLELATENLGSVATGSPVYLREMAVGRVVAIELAPDGKSVVLQAFIDEPYDRHVNARTRFWNVSGVSVSVGSKGLEIDAQSLLSLIAGGIAFESPALAQGDAAKPQARYRLYPSRAAAMALPEGASTLVRMRYYQPVRGLAEGAPVEFTGMEIGTVQSVRLDYDRRRQQVYSEVIAEVFPQRLGPVYRKLRDGNGEADKSADSALVRLLEHGLRAQVRSGSLLSGQLYVALELPPEGGKAQTDLKARPLEIPTMSGGVDQLLGQLTDIATKLNKIPFEQLGSQLKDTLKSAEQLLHSLDAELAPEAKKTLDEVRATLGTLRSEIDAGDGSVGSNMQNTLEEVNRAAYSLRNLSEYLRRHPEALLRGRGDAAPEPAPENPP